MKKVVTPGAVMTLPINDLHRDVGEEDRVVLVLSVADDEVTVLVLAGRLLGKGPGDVKVLHGLTSLLQPL
jgi:hypothetical protein